MAKNGFIQITAATGSIRTKTIYYLKSMRNVSDLSKIANVILFGGNGSNEYSKE